MLIPSGAHLDFTSLGSIQVTLLNFPLMGEVHYECQSQTMSLIWAPLQLAWLKSLDQPDSEEL